ncbi:enoyl-CoA hydratase/isomerase family protein [Achromobacter xylosoxidans]
MTTDTFGQDLQNLTMIKTEISDRIAVLTIDMPGRSMNVLTPAFAQQLRQAFDAVVADAGVDGIVITSGKSSFIAGADLAQMAGFADLDENAALEGIAVYGNLFRLIETAGKPVVGAAPGLALGVAWSCCWPPITASRYRLPASGCRKSSSGCCPAPGAPSACRGWPASLPVCHC